MPTNAWRAIDRLRTTCVVLLRPETLDAYAGRITVESAVLGNFDVEVAAKATQLVDALALAPPERGS